MSPLAIILVILLVLLIAGGTWGYRQPWYGPPYAYGGGLVGLVLLILIILAVLGYL